MVKSSFFAMLETKTFNSEVNPMGTSSLAICLILVRSRPLLWTLMSAKIVRTIRSFSHWLKSPVETSRGSRSRLLPKYTVSFGQSVADTPSVFIRNDSRYMVVYLSIWAVAEYALIKRIKAQSDASISQTNA